MKHFKLFQTVIACLLTVSLATVGLSAEEMHPETKIFCDTADAYHKTYPVSAEEDKEISQALSAVFASLYLPADDPTALSVISGSEKYAQSHAPGLTADPASVLPVHWGKLEQWQADESWFVKELPQKSTINTYTVTLNAADGLPAAVMQVFSDGIGELGFPESRLCRTDDFRVHRKKAYELIKQTDLKLAETRASRIVISTFISGYLLDDGVNQYFLLMRCYNPIVKELYKPSPVEEIGIEEYMSILTLHDLYEIAKKVDLGETAQPEPGELPTMGGGVEEASAASQEDQACPPMGGSEEAVSSAPGSEEAPVSSTPEESSTASEDLPAVTDDISSEAAVEPVSGRIWLPIGIAVAVCLAVVLLVTLLKKKK